jgi:hypothetical protein
MNPLSPFNTWLIPSVPSGKKVGRLKDLPNIKVSGLGRIRQSEPGVGFSLLVYKVLQDGFGIFPLNSGTSRYRSPPHFRFLGTTERSHRAQNPTRSHVAVVFFPDIAFRVWMSRIINRFRGFVTEFVHF